MNHTFKEIFGTSAGKVVTEVEVLADTWPLWQMFVRALSDKWTKILDQDFMCLKQVVMIVEDDRRFYIGSAVGRLVGFKRLKELNQVRPTEPGSLCLDVLNALKRSPVPMDTVLKFRRCLRKYG